MVNLTLKEALNLQKQYEQKLMFMNIFKHNQMGRGFYLLPTSYSRFLSGVIKHPNMSQKRHIICDNFIRGKVYESEGTN